MNDKFAVCIGKGGQRDQAESFARKTESIIADKPEKTDSFVRFERYFSDGIWINLSGRF